MDDDVVAGAVALAAARALLRVDTRTEAAAVLHAAVRDLGGRVVPADGEAAADGGIDVSLGLDESCVAVPADSSAATARRLRQLPTLVQDAEAAATRCDRYQHQANRARTDALTGLAGRREIDARLVEAVVGDVVCLLDLDEFKALNDTRGHAEGDRALRRFGQLLRSSVRDVDFVGRYGGDEFLIVFAGAPLPVAVERMTELTRAWVDDDPGGSVSIGLAVVDGRGVASAMAAADRALYRAKHAGGGAVLVATEGDYPAPTGQASPGSTVRP
ncbi:GGDEF domain-containing protein [Nocardioides sp. MAHUQ-72]|uniref:GGDEF domain-containing protein n=1 Tax=unclassified Nocardioides TaxID=2615069 RepID=UPI00361AB095